ncbi:MULTISPECIES: pilus assembly protein TadG-related protein [unclassified Janibacter]|uniref:pilus assembly protein TadG-related protein n=1 Tax=unclassified Janibacter TaxID=2649294 RepID=UPI003D039D33
MTTRLTSRRAETGAITPLIIGLVVVTMLAIVVGIGVTSAHLARMRLLDAADSAALDAADAARDSLYGEQVPQDGLALTDEEVVGEAAAYLGRRGLPPGIASWDLAPGTGVADGDTAVVVLTGVAPIPLVSSVLPGTAGSVTITVQSRARATIE